MKVFDEVKKEDSFIDLRVENEIRTTITVPSRPSNPTLSPSGLGCERGAAFKLMGMPTEEGVDSYEFGLPAAMGSFIHERIQNFLSLSPMWVDVRDYIKERPELGLEIAPVQKHDGEVSLIFSGYRNGKKVSPPFSFQCDGILNIDNEYHILEIKSEADRVFQSRTSQNPKHQPQGLAYGFLYDIRKVLWLYTSRESFGNNRKIYLQNLEQTKIEALVSMCNKIEKAVKDNNIKSLQKGKNCQYCAYRKACSAL